MMLRLWFTQKVKGVEMKNKNATILPQVRYTIAQHQFTCHMDFHKADVELTDSLCSRKSVEKLCSGGIPSKYKYLQQDIRLKNVNSAYSVVQHLKGFMYASLIKQFHDYVMEYFRTVLALIAKNPNKGTVLLQLRSACNRTGYQSLDFSFSEEEILNALNVSQLKELFAALGIVEELPTNLMGIGGAISGCGPAFMDLVMEAYADAAVKYGIQRPTAYRLVAQTMLGSAKLQQITGEHPGVLKDAVCSPNGTTIRGIDTLEKKGLRGACISSIDTIMDFKSGK